MNSLDELLDAARVAEPSDRIDLRDDIAAHGDVALDAMGEWLADRRLAGFAMRVVERIGADADQRSAAISALSKADQLEWPPHLKGDLERALLALGHRAPTSRAARTPTHRPPGMPGRPGRGYWVMRTSPWERPYLWAEALEGRLRQGWGVAEEQNLHVIADAVRKGIELTGLQREARRALRMLASWPGGMQLGDTVVTPNLPTYGRLSVFRVTGTYEWSPTIAMTWGERFGHALPVELIEQDIDRRGREVSEGLRAVLGAQTRLYNITGYGGDVERMVGQYLPMDRHGVVERSEPNSSSEEGT